MEQKSACLCSSLDASSLTKLLYDVQELFVPFSAVQQLDRFVRHAPQAGVRRMKIDAQMDPKSHPKIDIGAIRGPTFEVLGHVFWNAFFE